MIVKRIYVYVKWTLIEWGYHVRPFDMLADRRRWFWQPAAPCSFSTRPGR